MAFKGTLNKDIIYQDYRPNVSDRIFLGRIFFGLGRIFLAEYLGLNILGLISWAECFRPNILDENVGPNILSRIFWVEFTGQNIFGHNIYG